MITDRDVLTSGPPEYIKFPQCISNGVFFFRSSSLTQVAAIYSNQHLYLRMKIRREIKCVTAKKLSVANQQWDDSKSCQTNYTTMLQGYMSGFSKNV